MKESIPATKSTNEQELACPNCKQLKYKLLIAVHYFSKLDSFAAMHGADYTPSGWDLTARQLISVLNSDDACAELRKLNRTANYSQPD